MVPLLSVRCTLGVKNCRAKHSYYSTCTRLFLPDARPVSVGYRGSVDRKRPFCYTGTTFRSAAVDGTTLNAFYEEVVAIWIIVNEVTLGARVLAFGS